MLSDQLVDAEDVADKDHAAGRKPRLSRYHRLRGYRVCLLLVLALFGLFLFAAAPGAGNGHALVAQQAISARTSMPMAHNGDPKMPVSVGMGVGISSSARTGTVLPVASCNPFDVICWLTSAGEWIGQQILDALQGVINGMLRGPLDIITQTPPADTYQNSTVILWSLAFQTVVDFALASLIVIGGYHVIVGRGLGLPHSQLAEFLPRIVLAFGAAHFSLFFLGLFIDLENALCGMTLDLASHTMLTNIIAGVLQGNLLAPPLRRPFRERP